MPDALLRITPRPPVAVTDDSPASQIGRLAIRSLYREIALAPKPGLVTPWNNGSHSDMNYATFLRSLQALRPYFPAIAACGSRQPRFAALRQLGIEAEAAMLLATGGVNTHRGAIFNLGLLCATAGWLLAENEKPSASAVCRLVSSQWGDEIRSGLTEVSNGMALSHGRAVARRYGAGGARREAARGFPAAIEVGLPAYHAALAATGDAELAATQALFALIAELEDTNLLWRGGPTGLAFAQQSATTFLATGGVLAADWLVQANCIARDFSTRRLSPGGSADLLGVTLLLAEFDALP